MVRMTVPLTVVVGRGFATLERVGHPSEDPFGNLINDVPMTALWRTIAIDLRQRISEKDIPKPLGPVNGLPM